jgi:hypothetical protein
MSKLFVIILGAFLLFGCSVLKDIEKSPIASELITNQITLRFIAGSDNPVERADALRETLKEITLKVSGPDLYSLADIENTVRENIDWSSYSLADQELLNFGLTKARLVISELIDEGTISPDERYPLETLIQWIDQAAQRVSS